MEWNIENNNMDTRDVMRDEMDATAVCACDQIESLSVYNMRGIFVLMRISVLLCLYDVAERGWGLEEGGALMRLDEDNTDDDDGDNERNIESLKNDI